MWYKRNTNWIWITRRRKVRTVDFSFLVFLFLVCFIFINVMVYITLLRRCTLVSFYFFLLFFNHRFYLLSLNYYCNYTITLYKFLFFCNNFLYVVFPGFLLRAFPSSTEGKSPCSFAKNIHTLLLWLWCKNEPVTKIKWIRRGKKKEKR